MCEPCEGHCHDEQMARQYEWDCAQRYADEQAALADMEVAAEAERAEAERWRDLRDKS